VRSDIVPGGTFPDYSLPDQTGTVRTLSELPGRDPMILTLARGNYCPKEHEVLRNSEAESANADRTRCSRVSGTIFLRALCSYGSGSPFAR
jgi:peroxiredoxin